GRQPRDEYAGTLALEERHRERLQVVVSRDAKISQKPLAGTRRREDHEPLDERPRERQPHVNERGDVDRPLPMPADAAVDRVAQEQWRRDRYGSRADDAESCVRDLPPIRPEHPTNSPANRTHAASS